MNLIIWWLNHIKRCILVPARCEYTLWGPRAEIVDYAAKTVSRYSGLLIQNLGQLEDVITTARPLYEKWRPINAQYRPSMSGDRASF